MANHVPMPPEHELTQLHWFNLAEYGTRQDTADSEHVVAIRKNTELASNTPCMIYFGNRRIAALSFIEHNQVDAEWLNAQGLHSYLFEPMCSYIEGEPHNQNFFSEYDFETDLSLIRSEELESIKEYVVRNNLTNVTVHTCEYKVDFYFHRYLPYMKLKCDDLFLKTYTVYTTIDNGLCYQFDFQHKFISFIWRWGTHRNLIAAYLSFTSSNHTWYFDTSVDLLSRIDWFNFDTLKKVDPKLFVRLYYGAEKLKSGSPFVIDIKKELVGLQTITNPNGAYWPKIEKFKYYETPAFENSYTDNLQKYYGTSFCDIVTETRFAQHCANFSEKLLQPIKYRRPFIVVGPPRTLEYLRSFGITTFSDYWDESYDICDNHQDRMTKIFKIIDQINNTPMTELVNMFHHMWSQDIFHNNYNAMLEMTSMKFPQLPPNNESINSWKK